MQRDNGGYDDGYSICCPFWDVSPGSLVRDAANYWDFSCSKVVDLGCGEGKNAAFLAGLGARVDAVDVSDSALRNANLLWPNQGRIEWIRADVRKFIPPSEKYDVAVAYGVAHCLGSESEIESFVGRIRDFVRKGGLVIFCSFNDRRQEIELAHPNFQPTLLSHAKYLKLFGFLEIETASDQDLYESHPHNKIEHVHSLTRIAGRVNV